jgi:hypothetical protein
MPVAYASLAPRGEITAGADGRPRRALGADDPDESPSLDRLQSFRFVSTLALLVQQRD